MKRNQGNIMSDIAQFARDFLEACEAGKGWAVCRAFYKSDASFAAQAEPLAETHTLEAYTDWMKALLGFMPDGRYELRSFAVDQRRQNVCAFAVFLLPIRARAVPVPPPTRALPQTMFTQWNSMAVKFGT
jgi:hypothetical protein